MRVAITGSSGLIGSALGRSLSDDGHEVVPVVRDRSRGGVVWDPDRRTIDAAGLSGVDAVVHLAGEPIGARRWTDEQKRRIRESRTSGTRLLAETLATLDEPPAVLVSGSAIGVYGDRGDEVLHESSPAGTGFLAEVVQAWEAATTPAEDAGIRVARIRSGIVLERGEGALAKMLPLFRVGLGGRFGSGRQWWSWISIEDEVRAIRFLVDNDVRGPVNLVAPGPVTNREFTAVLGQVLRRPVVLPVPPFGPKLLLGAELAGELLFTSQRVEPRALTTAGFEFRHRDLDAALRAVLGKETGTSG
jgi:uncharacterized protein